MEQTAADTQLRQSIEEALLHSIDTAEKIPSSLEFAQQHHFEHADVVAVLKKLEAHGVIRSSVFEVVRTELTEDGLEVVKSGSPEVQLFLAIDAQAGVAKADAEKLPFGKKGVPEATKNKWITFDKPSGKLLRQASTVDDVVQRKLRLFQKGEALEGKDKLVLIKRKLLKDSKIKAFELSKGQHFSVTGIKKKALDLTPEMIASYSSPR